MRACLHSCSGLCSVFRDKCLRVGRVSKFQKAPCVTHGPPRVEVFGPPPRFSQVNVDHCQVMAFQRQDPKAFFVCLFSCICTQVLHKCLLDQYIKVRSLSQNGGYPVLASCHRVDVLTDAPGVGRAANAKCLAGSVAGGELSFSERTAGGSWFNLPSHFLLSAQR